MTTRSRFEGSLVLLLAVTAACADPEVPEVRVWTASTLGAEPPDDPCSIDDVAEGDAIDVWHRLPKGIHTEDLLTIEARTPCTSVPTTVRHAPSDDGDVARATLQAPPGASCSLIVTLTIANDIRTCERPTGPCEDLPTLCKDLDPPGLTEGEATETTSATASTGPDPTSEGTSTGIDTDPTSEGTASAGIDTDPTSEGTA